MADLAVSWVSSAFRRFVSAVVGVSVFALGLAFVLSGGVASAQASDGLPDWVNLSGNFDSTGFSNSDPVWEYRYPGTGDDWSANIEWGLVDGGNRGTSGSRENSRRELCHGSRNVDLNVVQFEVTWRKRNVRSRVPCSDLAPLFDATISVQYSDGLVYESWSFTCDLVYSHFLSRSDGPYVDCLTTDMADRPLLAPGSLLLVEVEESESFSSALVSPSFVRSGSRDAVKIRLADSSDQPLSGYHMGVDLYAGPSHDANPSPSVNCDDCITNNEGVITISYDVASLSPGGSNDIDYLRVYQDTGVNGRFDAGQDPFRFVVLQVVHAVDYVALGDSYSSGEAGESPPTGEYLKGDNSADTECRRWDRAYWKVLDGKVFGAGLNVETFACTGATAKNIFDANASNTGTNGPSNAVAENYMGANWEPRQAVSLGSADDENSVDMVTVTIGGNDMMFADVLEDCFWITCNVGSYEQRLGQRLNVSLKGLENELVAVYRELKAVTGESSGANRESTVFVFGYPHLVPSSGEGCRQLTVDPLVDSSEPWYTIARFRYPVSAPLSRLLGRTLLDINAGERRFLREAADSLNAAIRRASERAGVHFIDVSDAFDGHDPCSKRPWVYGVQGAPGIFDVGVSGRSFHPTEAGHAAYADVLARYIASRQGSPLDPLDPRKFERAKLTRSGLPVNPDPIPASSEQRAAGTSESIENPADSVGDRSEGPARRGVLLVRRQAASAGCLLYVPGERVTLSAGGFAESSTVSLSAEGVTAAGTALPTIEISAVTSDGEGRIEVGWTVPASPTATVDALPRFYAVTATGPSASGGTFTAVTARPVVAYPAAAPCAADDAASTTLGQAVRTAVLANDTAPYGGSLNPASVHIESASRGTVTVDGADGSLTYAPDPGFTGSETVRYWVYDNWGVGVSAQLAVTVNAGCTITGAAGVVDIVGTDGDDVICVPDPDDDLGFHAIDAKGGNDVVLGGDGADWIEGGPGDDVIYGRGGDDRVRGGSGADTVYSGRGFDTVISADLADSVVDEYGDDWFHGYELIVEPVPARRPVPPAVSDDEAHAGLGEMLNIGVLDNDYDPDGDLDASTLKITRAPATGTAVVASTDELGPHVRYTAASAGGSDVFGYEVCDLWGRCAAGEVTVTVGASGCTITGTGGDDTIYGTDGDDVICGLGGNDVIDGGGGNDTIFGGPGDDTLHGSWGDDTIWAGPGDDALNGNGGDDTLNGGSGDDTANGGGDDDEIWAGPGGDTANGNAGDDDIWGGLGDDAISGGNGDDTIWGGAGVDQLAGGTGADTLHGGEGDDALWGNTQNDTLRGGPGADVLRGGGGNDTLYGDTGNDRIFGNVGDDMGFGGWHDDTVDGGNGADYINGGDGDDACTRGETTARCEP